MRHEMMRDIHRSHKNITSCLSLARELVFWPKLNGDLRSYTDNCKVCAKFQRDKPQDKILLQEVPSRPWQFVAADLFNAKGKEFLVIADSYSGYFEVEEINSQSSSVVIKVLKKWFATHGIPDELRSDGGSCFGSQEFKNFHSDWRFSHRISSTQFPRSNGLAERYVQEGQNLILKCLEEKSDLQLALLYHRN